MVPRAVLMKSGLVSINTARQNISKTAVLVNTARQVNTAHSKTTVNAARPMSYLSKKQRILMLEDLHKNTTFKNSNINQRVNTVRGKKFNIARPKAVVNVVKGNNYNAVKASACWVWKPKHKVLDHVSKHNRNMSYLTNYKEIDGGYVDFGGNPKGGKITGKARTPQQNGVAEKRNKTLIEAARTMLADSKLPTTFWAEVVNTACYMQNRVLVVKPHNMIPYELFHGRTPTLSFMRPFWYLVTILNTIDHLGKFNGKADEGFFVRYSLNSKALRVFNSRTRIVEENLHISFSESTPNVVGSGLDWLFDVDCLANSTIFEQLTLMGYEKISQKLTFYKPFFSSQWKFLIHTILQCLSPKTIAWNEFSSTMASSIICLATNQKFNFSKFILDSMIRNLDNLSGKFLMYPRFVQKKVDEDLRKDSKCKDQEKEDNVNNTNNVNTISSTVNAADTNKVNVVGGKTRIELPFDPDMPALEDYSIFNISIDDEDDGTKADMNNLDITIQVNPNPTTRIHKDHPLDQVIEDFQSVLFNKEQTIKTFKTACLLAFYHRKNPKRIEAIRLFLAYASFKDFVVYQMDVKSAFRYGKIEEEVYVCQPPGFEDPNFLDRVYKMSSIGELTCFLGLQVEQKKDGIFISQDKYVAKILKKFRFTEIKTTSTPMETQKPLLKDENSKEVDVHMYRSMIGLLIYLTSSRPNIMFAVCACARYQVNPKVSHLHDVKFLGCRLISWQCKKQTVVANSTIEAEYVAASSCYGQVLWIQNQLFDYGYNFMHTKIFIDNNRKAKKSVRLMMGKLFKIELELMLVTQNTHNMVAFLSRPTKSDGFEQIMDFLNAHPIRYALTINPTIYISCIEQFWSTLKAKTINEEEQLHALVDGKKIIITESSVRSDDKEGIDCLPNSTIFEQLTLMGYEKISQKLTFL
ncbi:putative ribonuclease H-like domain-containing protein [Tanacetum coccineum]|uniref:Ribonuclease H-like domain-containing protein n=1 Tax=Tanacetum coccineum TaxID=301880 RepID=A0ABQ5HA37_9ASTR